MMIETSYSVQHDFDDDTDCVIDADGFVAVQFSTDIPSARRLKLAQIVADLLNDEPVSGCIELPKVIDWDDIEVKVEYDECYNEAPWDSCDGWEHEYNRISYYDHDDIRGSRGYGYSDANREAFVITIDDSIVTEKWRCTGYHGCSKQVRAESIARAKARAIDQLVKWYSDGWEWYVAVAKYGDYTDAIGGIDSYDYAEECAEDCRAMVVDQLESDGYIVNGKPAPPKPYNRVDSFREHIRRNMDCSY